MIEDEIMFYNRLNAKCLFVLFVFTMVCMGSSCKTSAIAGNPQKTNSSSRYRNWEIRQGKLYVDDKWVFLKVAKPLRNYADVNEVNKLIEDLDIIESKKYNCLEINCYWHHFDMDGDGVPDKSLKPLRRLVDAIYNRGMFPCLSVETYAVGGGNIPDGFWECYPDADAIDRNGDTLIDEEYGFNTRVPSIFSPDYRQAAHTFIKSIAKGVDTGKILYFETTVEPQYMGDSYLCYSKHARKAYLAWLEENNIPGPLMPESFPIPMGFCTNGGWNRFRAEFLAKWVNDDAAAFREIAGADAYIAVDYLETARDEMIKRNGNSLVFLKNLTSPNIIQINWHWHFGKQSANEIAYQNVRLVSTESGRDWAIAEHMTLNGSDFNAVDVSEVLHSTITHGSGFSWEFVNTEAISNDSFALYNDDWSPKPPIAIVDHNWKFWMKEWAGTLKR